MRQCGRLLIRTHNMYTASTVRWWCFYVCQVRYGTAIRQVLDHTLITRESPQRDNEAR
jgi:hypothetical protein